MNFFNLIFPKDLYCISCGRPLPLLSEKGIALCERCVSEITWVSGRICKKCGRSLADENPKDICHNCEKESHVFGRAFACVLYSSKAAELVRDMKYRNRTWYSDTLSAIMAEKYFSLVDSETGELPAYDFLVSVPMSLKKKASRGYDQAELITKKLSAKLNIKYLNKAIVRVKNTGVMSSLSLDERRANLAGAFSVPCDMINILAGKRILIADDVYTTGSSVNACAEALLSAGVKDVDVIVFGTGADVRRPEDRPAVVESPSQLRAKGPT